MLGTSRVPLSRRLRCFKGVAWALGETTVGTQGTPVRVLSKLVAQPGSY